MRRMFCSALWLSLFASAVPAQPSDKPLQRIAFGSCAHQDRPQPIWKQITARNPDLFLWLGDNIYGDTEDMSVLKAKYAKLAAQPGYQALQKKCSVMAIWDDHDYGVNDGGSEYPKKKQSQSIFLDFFKVPKDAAQRQHPGIYGAKIIGPVGKRAQIILLDTRYFRSPLKKNSQRPKGEGPYTANPDPKTTILGPSQWKWLEEQLKKPAEVRLIASSIQVIAEDHGWEKWMNFPHERGRLFQLIRKTKAGGVIFLSGDRHLAEISMMEGVVGYPLFDITSSGLNFGHQGFRRHEKNRHRVGSMNYGNNFGCIELEWDRPAPRARLQILDDEGDMIIQRKILLKTIQPKKKGS